MDPINIIRGEDKIINVRLVNQSDGNPYDLTGATPLTTCFQNADGTELSLSLSSGIAIVTAVAGILSITLTAAQTVLLATVQSQTLELSITQSGLLTKIQIPAAYTVLDSVC